MELTLLSLLTGKSMPEALILASTKPKYDNRLFIELQVQYKKTTSSVHVVYIKLFLLLFWHSEQFLKTQHVLNFYFSCTEHVI